MSDVIIGAGLIVLTALGLIAMYMVGHRHGYARLAYEMKNDHDLSLRVLEDLAKRHNARLELVELPGSGPTEDPTSPGKKRR